MAPVVSPQQQQTSLTNPTMHLYHIPQYTTLEQKCGLWDLWDWSIRGIDVSC